MSHPSSQATETGVVFPKGRDSQLRTSTGTAKKVLAAALAPLDAQRAAQLQTEPQWRLNYPAYFRRLVQSALSQPEQAVPSAQRGLDAAMNDLCWSRDGHEVPLSEMVARLTNEPALQAAPTLETKTLKGRHGMAEVSHPLSIPYKGKMLCGQALAQQARAWAVRGIIEASAAEALIRCVDNPQWFDLSDRTMVLLGAASEAGPLKMLCRWHANIVAVDLPRPAAWKRIAAIVEGGNSVVHVPLMAANPAVDWTERAGADLLKDLPEIATWVRGFKGPLDVAAHGYADGERHVRLAAAMDVIQAVACHDHQDSTLAFMATPTDVYAIPQATAAASMDNFRNRPWLSKVLQAQLALFTGKRFFQPNITRLVQTPANTKYAVVDGLVIQQGPNYALAKRLQQWRGLVARSSGHQVSINVAPPTETTSVLSNRAIAAGYRAADVFGVEVFQPETTTALMAALWVHDLRTSNETDHASAPSAHPMDLIAQGACHGGFWGVGYRPRTALPFVAGLGLLRGVSASIKRALKQRRFSGRGRSAPAAS